MAPSQRAAHHQPFEVTTLTRMMFETDGPATAKVAFGKDWKRDAERRDLTFNALYAQADGQRDRSRSAGSRIWRKGACASSAMPKPRHPGGYLRILRFFPAPSHPNGSDRPMPRGSRPAPSSTIALSRLSAERVVGGNTATASRQKIPSRALLWMRTTSVLVDRSLARENPRNGGFDSDLHSAVSPSEAQILGLAREAPPIPLLRPPGGRWSPRRMPPRPARRWRTGSGPSKADAARLCAWAQAPTEIEPRHGRTRPHGQTLYRHGRPTG